MQVAIDKMADVMHRCPYFERLLSLTANQGFYLVGGAIRDALTGRPIVDLDLISPTDPTPVAKQFAGQIGGHWFWLDKGRLQSRVVVAHHESALHYDFALFRAETLELDLYDRDFTINAVALELSDNMSASSLIDPLGGLNDLHRETLRMVGQDSFTNDPLRVIKGVRHATTMALDIETVTLQAMRVAAVQLHRVAPERVRKEVWKSLADENAVRGLRLFAESGVGEVLLGKDFSSHLEDSIGQLEHCRKIWSMLAQDHPVVNDWMAEEIEQGLTNETLMIWLSLLIQVDRKRPLQLAREWRLSRKARTAITAVLKLDQAALQEFVGIAHSERALTWWSVRYRVAPKLLVLLLATTCLSQGVNSLDAARSWVPLIACLDDQRIHDFVDGEWLRSELGLTDGPEMTHALRLLRNAEIYGQVEDQEEAMRFLRTHYQIKD